MRTEIEQMLMEHYEDMRKYAYPDITVEHCGYKVMQQFPFIDEKTYARRVFDARGKLLYQTLGEYQSKEELMDLCEKIEMMLLGMERIE